MKRLFAVIMMLLTILPLAACGSSTDSDEPDIIGMPNPFTDFNTLAEAEKQTGFYITLPDAIGSSNNKIYRAMNDEMLEVIYVNGEDETGRIRKARGSEDISGDYNEYAETETVSVGGIDVLLKGDAGLVKLAVLTNDGYAYSVSSALRSPAQVSPNDDLQPNEGDAPGFVQGGADIVELDSAAALSAAVGFEVNDIDLPFTPEQKKYISYWHELAEIDYTGAGKTARYRKAAGTEDCSGDYNVYTDVTEFEAGSITVTLKGDAGQYALAIWTDGSYSYSLSLSDGISLSDWQTMMSSIQS